MRRAVRLLVAVVVVGGILFLFVLPGRTYLDQGKATSRTDRQLAALEAENSALAKKASQLNSSSYLEQIAREQYGLVMPGQKAYGILPPEETTTTTTTPVAAR